MSDGRIYNGFQLGYPIGNHPNACAVGTALAVATAQAYCHEQHHGNLIGVQTSRMHLDAPSIYANAEDTFASADWVDVASWKRYIPGQATAIGFSLWFRMVAWYQHRVLARVKCSTATGEEVFVDIQPSGVERSTIGGSDQSRAEANRALYERLNAEWAGWTVGSLSGEVSLSGLTLDQRLTVTVQAYAVDSETELVAVRMRPEVVTAWWGVADG